MPKVSSRWWNNFVRPEKDPKRKKRNKIWNSIYLCERGCIMVIILDIKVYTAV